MAIDLRQHIVTLGKNAQPFFHLNATGLPPTVRLVHRRYSAPTAGGAGSDPVVPERRFLAA
jgi:hypothetical protein